jgi:SAM-dependent methyltransferase
VAELDGSYTLGLMGTLEERRLAQLELVRPWIPPQQRVLEVGGGSGYQASVLRSWGHDVRSIDIAVASQTYHPVELYDGAKIPFPDASFDVVFSSNVLEHLEAPHALLREMRRVLTPGGRAVHVVPSATWRAATSLTHYVFLAKYALGFQRSRAFSPSDTSLRATIGKRGVLGTIMRVVFPGPHGAYRNAVIELHTYTRRRWVSVFNESGFSVAEAVGQGLFYTGNAVAPNLSITTRRRLGRLLGSTSHAFLLRPA